MKGFTLIELLLSVAIMAILGMITIPIFQSFQTRNDLDVAVNTITQNLRRAQLLAQASNGDTTWGLKIQSGSITLFKGPNFAGRDATYDETFDLSTSINPTGLTEEVFSKLTGLPQSTGTTTLSSLINANETRTITINAKGTISY